MSSISTRAIKATSPAVQIRSMHLSTMTSSGPSPSTVTQHLAGTGQAWHDKISSEGPFPPERGRYRLYIGLFCPFAHRANLVRHLKPGLADLLPITVVKPYPKGDENGWPGWQFPSPSSNTTADSNNNNNNNTDNDNSDKEDEYPGATPDPLYGAKYLHELYFKADPAYKGRYSVPVLWDTQTHTIVNNESAELLRDLQTCFDEILPTNGDTKPETGAMSPSNNSNNNKDMNKQPWLYPPHLRTEIDAITNWMQRDLNTGVYKAGFATTQESYDAAVPAVFAALNKMEKLIARNGGPFILGREMTELDIRAYATVVRFDTVYVQHFKCNLGTIRHDYPQINNWLKNLYWNVKGFRESTDFKHIKENYTKSHAEINPRAITPMGPWPEVEGPDGYESDVGKLRIGGVKMPLVLELEEKLQ
ncbi:glutathione S-transferase [Coniella lustricola]|uniref:Glutathione S-transferase n=1 Tax=Coniella lustricola TaxID=2025994 RepID=A0A2T3A9A7_9PEZI|nr:glutathione S-transferase [Coniella lustricola]